MRTVYDISSYDPIHVAAEALPTDNRLHITSLRITSSPRQISSVPLERQGHGATGTAHPNRGISKELKEAKGSDKAGAGPLQYNEVEAIPTVDGFVPQIVWKDYSLVLFLSTVHTGADEYKEAEEMTGQ
ncbi:hypothetical protein FOPG_18458 [Fusarium oxysporum f. sp. conglutinans race 2 54008]|uniref:Uncharacterized protein n=1 Tax=Fusarium oxysporum f. sp. conglutinans race 2 54008 TaxID=1089457 RepID=X0GZS3_FUSOX|nr:hypothetical protein FOPG_18458 [Fusarium oxysporum f. sp. conglutinans race 2 54008]